MPWTPRDATRKTKKADTKNRKKQWSAIANAVLAETGSDEQAVRVANGVIKRRRAAEKSR